MMKFLVRELRALEFGFALERCAHDASREHRALTHRVLYS
jgi:hypothetical protein